MFGSLGAENALRSDTELLLNTSRRLATRQILAEAIIATQTFHERMMRRKKKTTIVTFESRERMTIQQSSRSLVRWCDRCRQEAFMVTPHEAAAISRSDARAIFRAVETGTIHSIETESGQLLVCSNSIPLR